MPSQAMPHATHPPHLVDGTRLVALGLLESNELGHKQGIHHMLHGGMKVEELDKEAHVLGQHPLPCEDGGVLLGCHLGLLGSPPLLGEWWALHELLHGLLLPLQGGGKEGLVWSVEVCKSIGWLEP